MQFQNVMTVILPEVIQTPLLTVMPVINQIMMPQQILVMLLQIFQQHVPPVILRQSDGSLLRSTTTSFL